MKKRILSLLLCVCMLLSLAPMMAIAALAEEGTPNPAVSTTFSYDGNNPNFPTLDLPLATDASEKVALDKYDFGGITKYPTKISGAVTYNGSWQVGALAVTWDQVAGTVTAGTTFNAYTMLCHDASHDLSLGDTKGNWGSSNAPAGGGLFLAYTNSSVLVAPINYDNNSNANNRNVVSYEATSSIRYNVEYTGTISIDAAFAFAFNNGIDLQVLHNGVVVATIENNDPEKQIGLGGTNTTSFDFGEIVTKLDVVQGDTIDFAMIGDPTYDYAHVGDDFNYQESKRGIRNFSFTVSYEEGWTYIDYEALYYTSQWDQSTAFTSPDRNALNDIPYFYTWYNADGTAKKNEALTDPMKDTDYAQINPVLFEKGILTEDMTWDEMWDAYGAFLETRGRFTYTGDWTAGNLVNGEYQTIDTRVFTYGRPLYACRTTNSGVTVATYNWENQFASSFAVAKIYLDDYIAKGKALVQPGEDGKLFFSEISGVFTTAENVCMTYSHGLPGHGTLAIKSGVYAIRPNGPIEATGLTFTVPTETYGTATIDLASYINYCNTTETDANFAIVLNDEAVWPAGASIEDPSTWYTWEGATLNASVLTEAIKAAKIEVSAGDAVRFLFTRGQTGAQKITLDFKPTITIEKKNVVEFTDQYGELIFRQTYPIGSAMPAVPVATDDGFYINGALEKVDTLPEKVEEHLFIQYAGDFKITPITVDKMSIGVGTDFAVNLYLKADPFASRVGIATDDIADTWGVKQADGTFKVTLPGVAAKDLATDINVYMFQEFNGGLNANNDDVYTVSPVDILTVYTTDAAYAEYKDLASAALDYAAAADAYFNGADLSADVAARLAEQDAAIAALSKDVAIEDDFYDYTIYGATVVLKEQVAIKIQVTLTEIDNLDDDVLDFTVAVEGLADEISGFTFQAGSDLLNEGVPTAAVITLNGMTPAEFSKVWTITVMDGFEQMTGSVSYSVNSYIARTFEGGAGEADNLLRALYALGVAASA